MRSPRMNHVATLLPNGDVLLIGGQSDLTGQQALSSTEIYRVAQNRFEAAWEPYQTKLDELGLERTAVTVGLATTSSTS